MVTSDFPELIIDYKKYDELADNIWQAQMGGHPPVLTYNGPRYQDLNRVTLSNREQAMRVQLDGEVFNIPKMLSRDEYPFACTKEGGGSSWVGHIPAKQNSAQGGLIAALIKKHNLDNGKQFRVRVINHPKSGKI